MTPTLQLWDVCMYVCAHTHHLQMAKQCKEHNYVTHKKNCQFLVIVFNIKIQICCFRVSHLTQVEDLLDNHSNGGRVCLLEGGLGLQVLEELQTLSGAASTVLSQSCWW